MKLIPDLTVKKQIIILFVVFTVILACFAYFNYYSLKNYENAVRSIKNKTVKKLSIIGEISISTGINQSNILHYLYSYNTNDKLLYSKRIIEITEQNDILFNNLLELISKGKTQENLELLLMVRSAYLDKVIEIINTPNTLPNSRPFRFHESEIRFLFEEYFKETQNISKMIIEDAEDEIANTMAGVLRVKFISNILIAIGIFILLVNSFFISRIYKHLQRDYQSLREEKIEKTKAKEELERLNQQLEEKIKERTKELEEANREISLYNTELRKMGQAKDKFISVISHDLRNPISTILASSDVIMEKDVDKEELNEFAKIINRASVKVMNQLNELVDWAKTRRIQNIFKPVKLNLWESVNDSIQLIENLAKQNNVKLEVRISSSIFINADRIMFRSIIQNLVTNSIKFTPALGTVTIDAVEKGEMVEITVRDTGVGMTKEVKESLFTKKDAENEEKIKKKGMGLELVMDFIEKHGGTIEVESEIGKGSTFTFTIPRADEHQ